jgi:hypothetical protein
MKPSHSALKISTPLLSSSALIASRAGWHSATPDTYRRFAIMLAPRKWGWLKEDDFLEADKAAGLPIGLIPGADFLQTVVSLEPHDLLVLYTDGVTEAENNVGQSLDRDQLLKWAREAPIDSPESLGKALLGRLELFQGRCRTDDETLVVLQRDKASLFASPGNVVMNHSVPPQAANSARSRA